MPFLGTEYGSALTSIAGMCSQLSYLALTVATFEALRNLKARPNAVLGTVNGCLRAASLAGIALSEWFFERGFDIMQLVSFSFIALYLIGAALLTTVHMLTKNQQAKQAGPTPESLAIAQLTPDKRKELELLADQLLRKRCDLLAERHLLTAREREVLYHLAKGKSIAKISDDLYISTNTVKTHVKMVYVKADIHNRQELAALIDSMEDTL
ncbi:hypothetical protein EGYY_03280 [Eggerthella sp. YY7918]|nr:hypothetical protein EGYY_03280 [Eggerthella sp. YY7918]